MENAEMPSYGSGPLAKVASVILLSLGLLLPAVWSGGPIAFHDSEGYHNGGAVAVEYFLDKIGISASPDTESLGTDPVVTGDGGDDFNSVVNVRSIPYSVFTYMSVSLLGLTGSVALASLATAWLIWLALVPLQTLPRLAAGGAVLVVTPVAFYSAQMMPDIFAAWLILIPLVVVQHDGRPGLWLGLALLTGASAAIVFHYSHIPLAAAMGLVLSTWYLWRRRPLAAFAVQLPLALAMAINIVISASLPGTSGISVTPARMPIMLARSLGDGVAVRYLTEKCGEIDFTICDIYEVFPTYAGQALFGDDSIRSRATPEQMVEIREQEISLVWQVFLYDPPAQTWALIGNAAHQFVRFGLDDAMIASFEMRAAGKLHVDLSKTKPSWFALVEGVQILSVALAGLFLGVTVFAVPSSRVPVTILVLGLVTNAFVCGALSAPADRYQGRIVWLVVLTAVGFGARALPLASSPLSKTGSARGGFSGPS